MQNKAGQIQAGFCKQDAQLLFFIGELFGIVHALIGATAAFAEGLAGHAPFIVRGQYHREDFCFVIVFFSFCDLYLYALSRDPAFETDGFSAQFAFSVTRIAHLQDGEFRDEFLFGHGSSIRSLER